MLLVKNGVLGLTETENGVVLTVEAVVTGDMNQGGSVVVVAGILLAL